MPTSRSLEQLLLNLGANSTVTEEIKADVQEIKQLLKDQNGRVKSLEIKMSKVELVGKALLALIAPTVAFLLAHMNGMF